LGHVLACPFLKEGPSWQRRQTSRPSFVENTVREYVAPLELLTATSPASPAQPAAAAAADETDDDDEEDDDDRVRPSGTSPSCCCFWG